jgi:hypothetical protein
MSKKKWLSKRQRRLAERRKATEERARRFAQHPPFMASSQPNGKSDHVFVRSVQGGLVNGH